MPSPYKAVLAAIFFLWWLCVVLATTAHAEVPRASLPYQRMLTREARLAWGLNAPVPMLAGQIQQESHWDPTICSRFACGLTQFTPATADWISGAYSDLAENNVFNPEWAIRALVRYDHRLEAQTAPATTDCDNFAFALSAYNGGLGWVMRDRRLCEADATCNPQAWWGNVERFSSRSRQALLENRGYPRTILLEKQFIYTGWGVLISCSVSTPIPSP